MNKFQSILTLSAVALTLPVASAGGCYPSYSAGSKYSIGAWVSASITTTTPITYNACSPAGSGSCPASGYKQEGGVTTTEKFNFQCNSEYWCSQSGYAPGGTYSSMAWNKESTACTGSVTLAPTKSPVFSSLVSVGGCPVVFAAGTEYQAGDRISLDQIVYQCRAWPLSQFCPKSEFKPNPTVATGLDYWKQAWEAVGYCSGALVATNAPTSASGGGGCPAEWSVGDLTTYKENDSVSVVKTTSPLVKMVYKCKAWPYSGFCGQFSPLHAAGGSLGWDLVGGCSGTIAPTIAPTFAAGSVIDGCPNDYSSAVTTYMTGDQVSQVVGTYRLVYKCREWPNEGWCNKKEYAPGGAYSDMAWTKLGPCAGTLSPTAAPTAFAGDCKFIKVVTSTPTPTPVVLDIGGWSSSMSYDAGDKVRLGSATYQCKPWPFYFWCRISAYKPTLSSTGLWTEVWSPSGQCEYVSLAPTAAPTFKPTASPTSKPTSSPSRAPTFKPTASPSRAPTASPSHAPSHAPTASPSRAPTASPSRAPSHAPTAPPSS